MNISKKILSCIILFFFSGFNFPAFSGNLIAIEKSKNLTKAGFHYTLTSSTENIQKNTFLSEEHINFNFFLNIARKDIGFQSDLFLVANFNSIVYMRNMDNQWQPWDGQYNTLQPTIHKKLNARETIIVLDKKQLSTGKYTVYAGYKTKQGDINYNREPVTFMVSGKSLKTTTNKTVNSDLKSTASRFKQLNDEAYTLQLIAAQEYSSISQLTNQYTDKLTYLLKTNNDGKIFFILAYGVYDTSADAKYASTQLPATFQLKSKPWIRQIKGIKSLIP